MKAKEVYVIYGSSGEYDDYHRWVVGITFSESIANQIAEEYNEQYINEIELPYPIDEFYNLEDYYGALWDSELGDYVWSEISDEKFTPEIVQLFQRYDDNRYSDYYPADVRLESKFYE